MSDELYSEPVNAPVSDELPEADLASLLGVNDSREEWYPIKEWGFKVKIKSLSKADQIRCRKMATRQGRLDSDALEGFLLMAGIVQPRMSAEHLDRLQSKNVGTVSKLLRKILEISNMMDGDAEKDEEDFQE